MLSFSAEGEVPDSIRETLFLPVGSEGAVWFRPHVRECRRMHRHDELEFNLVLGGTAAYLLGERRHEMKRGSLLWLFPAQDHALLDFSEDFSMWIAIFTPELVRRVCVAKADQELTADFAPQERCGRQIVETELSRLDRLLWRIATCADASGDGGIARINAGLAWLLLCTWDVHNAADGAIANRAVHPAVEKAVRLLRDEAAEPPLLDNLASRAGLSTSRLGHLFHDQIGQTIPAFRNRQRVERYLRLRYQARNGGSSLSCHHAALEAGFGSYSQFHRVFQAAMGCSPKNYEEQQAQQD